jgi:hypothetical protein
VPRGAAGLVAPRGRSGVACGGTCAQQPRAPSPSGRCWRTGPHRPGARGTSPASAGSRRRPRARSRPTPRPARSLASPRAAARRGPASTRRPTRWRGHGRQPADRRVVGAAGRAWSARSSPPSRARTSGAQSTSTRSLTKTSRTRRSTSMSRPAIAGDGDGDACDVGVARPHVADARVSGWPARRRSPPTRRRRGERGLRSLHGARGLARCGRPAVWPRGAGRRRRRAVPSPRRDGGARTRGSGAGGGGFRDHVRDRLRPPHLPPRPSRRRPGGAVGLGQPVTAIGRHGTWREVRTQFGARGWLPSRATCG